MRRSADQGFAEGQWRLGHYYESGLGVREDDTEAAHWYRLAAEQGYAPAQHSLGLLYAEGYGVPKDLALAYMWNHLSASQQGYSPAKKSLATIFRLMTPEQVAEAQSMSREWLAAHGGK